MPGCSSTSRDIFANGGPRAPRLPRSARGGDEVLDRLDRDLGRDDVDPREQELLARVGRAIGGSTAVGVLRRHVEHPDRDVGLAVLRALAAIGSPGSRSGADPVGLEAAVVSGDLEHATHVLRALVTFEDSSSAELLRAALRDELGLLRRRIVAELSIRYGAAGLDRVAFAIRAARRPLARACVGVARRHAHRHRARRRRHSRSCTFGPRSARGAHPLVPARPITQRALLLELVEDPERRWRRPWIRACALYAASDMPDALDDVMDAAESWAASAIGEEAAITQETLAELRRRGFGT